jgi:hypothetical protein
MLRTQILFEPWQQKLLAQRARQLGKSVSQLVREWVSEKLGDRSAKKDDPLLRLSGIARDKGGACDVSERHDDYLYGRDADPPRRKP